MALTNTPGGDKILNAVRDAVSMQRAVANEGEAALLPMRIGKAQRSYRLRTTPMRDAKASCSAPSPCSKTSPRCRRSTASKPASSPSPRRKLRDPLRSSASASTPSPRATPANSNLCRPKSSHGAAEEAEALDDLMADLIEVAELETGRRELKLENLRPIACSAGGPRPLRRGGRDQADRD